MLLGYFWTLVAYFKAWLAPTHGVRQQQQHYNNITVATKHVVARTSHDIDATSSGSPSRWE